MATLGQLARRRYSPMSARIADSAIEMISSGDYERVSSLLAHLGVDGGIEAIIDRAVAQAICGAADVMLKNAAAYCDPWHYSDTLNLHMVGALISRIEDSKGER